VSKKKKNVKAADAEEMAEAVIEEELTIAKEEMTADKERLIEKKEEIQVHLTQTNQTHLAKEKNNTQNVYM
jgi:hypothetical protein